MLAPARLLFCATLLLGASAAQTAAVTAGTSAATLLVDGVEREYLLHVPPAYDGEKHLPLVLFLHGRGGNGAQASRRYGMSQLADQHGFLVAYPSGNDYQSGWRPDYYRNTERGGGGASSDLPFLTALLDHLTAEYSIDKRRVFAAGHSAGGIMSYALAGALSDRIAAVGVVAGSIGLRQPDGSRVTVREPEHPVAVIAFHGQRDPIIAYDEEHGRQAAYRFFVSAPDSVAFFAAHAGCDKPPKTEELLDGKVLHRVWSGGRDGTSVELYTLLDGGHSWPSARRGRGLSASERIWEFFAAHPKPAATVAPAGKR